VPLRRFCVLVATVGFVLVLPAPAAAHHLIVDPPGGGNATEHWVGGPPGMTLPENAGGQGLHESPIGLMPAAHSAGPNDDKGLVQACTATRENGHAAVSFVPPGPPGFVDCRHGPP
jgi:hypothetical protein